MANNPNVNKVIYDGNTLIDITDTTAVEEDVDTGKVFYKASGARSVGTGSSGSGKMDLVTNPTAGNVLITDANGQAQDAGVEPIYYETVASGVDAVLVGIDMDLLWTNANPTSAFAAQTVSLDLSNYSMIFVECIRYASNVDSYSLGTALSKIGEGATCTCAAAISSTGTYSVSFRAFTCSASGVTFGNGRKYDGVPDSDERAVPYKIYGIR